MRPAERDRPSDLRLIARYAGIGVGVGIAAAGVIGGLLVGLGAIVAARFEVPPGALPPPARRTRTDRESGGLQRVERTIERGYVEVERFNLRMRPWLVELAEHRLRHHAAVDPHREPDRARELLGGTLWQLTQQPLTTAPTRQQLADWVARIEAL